MIFLKLFLSNRADKIMYLYVFFMKFKGKFDILSEIFWHRKKSLNDFTQARLIFFVWNGSQKTHKKNVVSGKYCYSKKAVPSNAVDNMIALLCLAMWPLNCFEGLTKLNHILVINI